MSIYSLSSNKKESYYQDSVDNRLYKTWTNGLSTFKFNNDGTGVRHIENDEKFTWDFIKGTSNTSGTITIGNESTNFMLPGDIKEDQLSILDGGRGWVTFNPSTKENYQDSQNYWGYTNQDKVNNCVRNNGNNCENIDICYQGNSDCFCMIGCNDKDGNRIITSYGDCSLSNFDPKSTCPPLPDLTASPLPFPDN